MSFTRLVQRAEKPTIAEGWVKFTTPEGEQVWLHLASLARSSTEWVAFLGAGPLAQLAAMAVGLLLAHFAKRELLRGIGLLVALIDPFGPMGYQIRSTFSGAHGDEYFIAHYLSVPKYVITGPIALASAAGFVAGLQKLKRWRTRLRWMMDF